MEERTVPEIALLFYYKEIILYYENDIRNNPYGFRVSDAYLTQFINGLGAPIRIVNSPFLAFPPISYKNKPESFFFFTQKNNKSTIVSFLFHLRNCFAHNRFSLITIEGQEYLCLEDYSIKGKCTMIAQVPYISFFNLVYIIKRIRRNK